MSFKHVVQKSVYYFRVVLEVIKILLLAIVLSTLAHAFQEYLLNG